MQDLSCSLSIKRMKDNLKGIEFKADLLPLKVNYLGHFLTILLLILQEYSFPNQRPNYAQYHSFSLLIKATNRTNHREF